MYLIRKQFKFEMAHQLHEAYSCACTGAIHGHSYIVEVFFGGSNLDKTGMVIDFGEVNDLFKSYINDYWDHSLVMPNTFDKEYLDILGKYNKKLRIIDYNPTAEKMARVMFNEFHDMLLKTGKHELLKGVRIHETATGWAEYSE